MKKYGETYFTPLVKHVFHYTISYETHNYSTAIGGDVLFQISSRSVKNSVE